MRDAFVYNFCLHSHDDVFIHVYEYVSVFIIILEEMFTPNTDDGEERDIKFFCTFNIGYDYNFCMNHGAKGAKVFLFLLKS